VRFAVKVKFPETMFPIPEEEQEESGMLTFSPLRFPRMVQFPTSTFAHIVSEKAKLTEHNFYGLNYFSPIFLFSKRSYKTKTK